jgi:hypothetical protein
MLVFLEKALIRWGPREHVRRGSGGFERSKVE